MKYLTKFLLFQLTVVLMIALTGCGGGGGTAEGLKGKTYLFNLSPNQAGQLSVGEMIINIPAGTFPSGSVVKVTTYSNPIHRPANSSYSPIADEIEIQSSSPP